jgi:hypothetical protein
MAIEDIEADVAKLREVAATVEPLLPMLKVLAENPAQVEKITADVAALGGAVADLASRVAALEKAANAPAPESGGGMNATA